MILKFHAETPIVKGFNRSAVYDLPRNEYDFIPIEVGDKFLSLENSTFEEIKTTLNQNEKDWLNYFLEKEFCFFIPKEFVDCFPKIVFKWETPSLLTNAIIDIENLNTDFDFKIFEKLNCKHIVIRFVNISDTDKLFFFIKDKLIDITFKSVEVVFENTLDFKIKDYSKLKKRILQNVKQITDIRISKKLKTKAFRPNFVVNINVFSESQKNNTYFNRKLFIDSLGNTKNGVELTNVFSNINIHTNIEKTINSSRFQKIWSVNKDRIDVCKDCEFRYMCIDNRVPIERKKSEFYFKSECSYNPYISQWYGNKDYRTLKSTGIISNETGFFIDEEKVKQINKILWEE